MCWGNLAIMGVICGGRHRVRYIDWLQGRGQVLQGRRAEGVVSFLSKDRSVVRAILNIVRFFIQRFPYINKKSSFYLLLSRCLKEANKEVHHIGEIAHSAYWTIIDNFLRSLSHVCVKIKKQKHFPEQFFG